MRAPACAYQVTRGKHKESKLHCGPLGESFPCPSGTAHRTEEWMPASSASSYGPGAEGEVESGGEVWARREAASVD